MAYTLEQKRDWRRRRRQDYIDSQGNVCANCGSTDNLEVDHIDPATKTMYPRDIWSATEIKRVAELSKCQVLCNICHKNKTKNEWATGIVYHGMRH